MRHRLKAACFAIAILGAAGSIAHAGGVFRPYRRVPLTSEGAQVGVIYCGDGGSNANNIPILVRHAKSPRTSIEIRKGYKTGYHTIGRIAQESYSDAYMEGIRSDDGTIRVRINYTYVVSGVPNYARFSGAEVTFTTTVTDAC